MVDRPLIISAAIGMPTAALCPFVRSIQAANFPVDVVFLRHSTDEPLPSDWSGDVVRFWTHSDFRMAAQRGVSRLPAWRYIARVLGLFISALGRLGEFVMPLILHPMLGRYFYAREVLRSSDDNRLVALVDSRNVIMQANPFPLLGVDTLVVGEEEHHSR